MMKMNKIGHQAIIKNLQMMGLIRTATHEDMVSVLGYDASSFATVKMWAAEFKRESESLDGGPVSGRPTTSTTDGKRSYNNCHDDVCYEF